MNADATAAESSPQPPKRYGRLGGLVDGGTAGALLPAEPQRIKKPNEALTLKVIGDQPMGFLHRKLLNVLIRVAQDEKQPGRRLPPIASTYAPDHLATAREYFWAPLDEFVRDARFDSNDTKLLKASLEQLQELRLRSEGPDWLSEVPVPSVRFVEERGKSTWVGFTFAPETRRLVTRPRQYTEIFLQAQRQLHSGPAIALYERCRQYLGSPAHKTARAPWTDWYYWLSGQPITKPPPQFKYWNRDTLKRVEQEINSVTDIRIERIEFRVGRQVEDLQYTVNENPQTSIAFPGKPPIDTALRDRLLALKIPADRADKLIDEWDSGRLRANLAYTEEAYRRGVIRQKPISYLLAALRDNFAGNVETAKASLANVQSEAPHDLVREEFETQQARDALQLFNELDASERERALAAFLDVTTDLVRDQYRRSGLDSPLVKAMLGRHFAKATWGEPTPAQLLEYANRRLSQQRSQSSGRP